MVTNRKEIFESTYKELSSTLERQLDIEKRVSGKAVEITKFNLLVGSIVITGVSYFGPNKAILYLLSGVLALILSIWYCIQAVSPYEYEIGLDEEVANEVDSVWTTRRHYKKMMYAHAAMVKNNDEPYYEKIENFEKGLWSAIAALLFFAGTIIRIITPSYPLSFDFPVLLVISIVVLWGKDKEE